MLRFFPLAAVVLGAVAGAPALADALGTDRPDFVESSSVVGRGRFQLETSVAHERDKAAGLRTRSWSTPTLLRYGLNDDVELRLEGDGALRTTTTDTATGDRHKDHGWSDAGIGIKWHVQDGDEDSHRPAMAWLLGADLATGSRAFRGQGVRPSLRAVWEWELPSEMSVGVMPGLFADRDDAGSRYVGGIAALTVGKGWNEQWRSFVEVAAQRIARRRDGGSVVTFDVGSAYLVSDDVQVDLAFAFGVNRNAPNFAWTTGLSIRF